MANTFCRQLSNGYKINAHGDKLLWSPCCFYTKKTDMSNAVELKRDMDYARNATGWLPECSSCKNMEESGVEILKPRLNANHLISADSVTGDCVNLEISFDTKCNAACLSCGSYCSTTWAKFEKKHNLNLSGVVPKVIKLSNSFERKIAEVQYKIKLSDDDTDTSDVLFQKLINTVPLDKLETIFIMGGEPFYTKSHLKMLRHLKEVHPDLSKVSIRYQSNGSIYPSDEVLKLWEDYKFIIYGASLDGVGERFNYLRWPLKWHRCGPIVKRLINETNAQLHVNCTVSPLNILYVDELENWLKDNIPADRMRHAGTIVRPNACLGTMDLQYTNQKLRDKVFHKYGDDHDISKMFSNMKLYDDASPMFNYIEQMDKIRRTDWRKTFPDIVDCYSNV
jgi:hypothetical protein